MKQNTVIIILCVILVALIAVAAVFYNMLSEKYVPSDIQPPETTVQSGDEAPAETAPDFSMKNGDGEDIKLSDFFGKPIVINFWATWCPPCKSELPAFENAYNTYKDDVQFIMLNQTDGARDTFDVVNKFVSDNGYTFPVYYDTTFDGTYAYGAFSIPLTVLINADGTVADTHIGAMSEATLITYIEDLIK